MEQRDDSERVQRSTTLVYEGHSYTIKQSTTLAHHYRCSTFRSSGCKAKLRVGVQCRVITSIGVHTRNRQIHQAASVRDIRAEMQFLAVQRALEFPHVTPTTLWRCIDSEMMLAYNSSPIVKETKKKIINLIVKTRNREFGTHLYSKIVQDRYTLVSEEDRRPFLLWNATYLLPERCAGGLRKRNRILVWSYPELVAILRRPGITVLIDATFRCIPKPYKQCIILMVFDDETDM